VSALFDDPADDAKVKRKHDKPEHRLSHWLNTLLDRILTGDCWYTAIDHSGAETGRSQAERDAWHRRQAYQGIKSSHLDWYAYQRETGIFTQFELKVGSNKPTDGQCTTMRLLGERHIPTGCFYTLREVYDFLRATGFVLHGNSAGILAEVEARHAAADRAAAVKKTSTAKAPRSYKPRTAKPTLRQVARTNALRSRVMF